ncbi:MAG: SDR family oxidoreductase [Hyphomicrobiales bacterium]
MAGRLEGKKTLVTAAAQGIGHAVAKACANEGAIVTATDINEDKVAKELSGYGNVTTKKFDVLDGDEIKKMAAEIGAVDALFNLAGFVHSGTILESTDEEWDFAFNLNARAMYRTSRAFLPAMLEAGGGSIINMSSAVSSLAGAPIRCVYSASKAAVIGLTKSIARDFIDQGVRCNCICPGTIQSPSLEERITQLGETMGGVEKAREWFIARQPMGRVGTTEEVAALAVYFASDESRFTTGTTAVIDGGFTL